ncbi:MAG: hypothetical protein Q8Q26_14140 [Pseudorhodobacter sp.]|nr:hypothetical protein [Pseudorhodobacter sp.]
MQQRAEIKGERNARITAWQLPAGLAPKNLTTKLNLAKSWPREVVTGVKCTPPTSLAGKMFQTLAGVGLKQFFAVPGNIAAVGNTLVTVGARVRYQAL